MLGDVRYAYLTREDRVAQAVSMYRAKQSGLWHRDRRGRPFRSRPDEDAVPQFDGDAILGEHERISAEEGRWEALFETLSVSPLRITYEEIEADTTTAIGALASLMDVEWAGSASLAEAATQRLADDVSAEWTRRVRERLARS